MLHVADLTTGLKERRYDTTLVAGLLARGESSMPFVGEELGVERLIDDIDALHRVAQRSGAAAAAIFSYAANAGFFLPENVIRPDCHPLRLGSSLSRNHSIS